MNDKERLLQWIKEQNISAARLANATGDHASAISMMTVGPREVSQAFKWRFGKAFGFDVAEQIFIDEPLERQTA
jgi:plasmid maintenance system antidote protein VapI